MEDLGFILGSYIITIGSIALLARWTLRRGRRLARTVRREDLPWT